ncbi:hypothetical protein [Capnocytophaga gingivalis]|uniref:Leucine Rich Repeat protein n=1 Tax=Capnocytophaga gingivalis TaxID=1017 RepID=A0ABU5ZA24_9FLAO|nr:hypothetical protein [Capnocytophaga gingivalis]MEB3075233.1 hypothetical protein [Capnocytophaga gingivalis]
MKRVFLLGLSLMCLLSCDKSKIANTIINKDYDKIRDNASSDDSATELTLSEYLLENGYDKDNDGTLQDSELAQIQTLSAVGKSITNLDVLSKMTNLKQADFSGNKIAIAIINAPLLVEINLSNNRLMTLDISRAPKLIDNINITGNPKLTCVKATSIQLTSLRNTSNNIKTDVDNEGKSKVSFSNTCN